MEKVNVHLPYAVAEKYLPAMMRRGVSPELYFTGGDLDGMDLKKFERFARRLEEHRLKPSVHAPFLDINLAASDPAVVRITRERLVQTIELASLAGAAGIVIHPGFDPFRFRGFEDNWLSLAKKNLAPIVKKAESRSMPLAVENIFEEHYGQLKALIEHFSSPVLGHCFDTGHFNIFSRTGLTEWMHEMGRHTFALHVHDNHGVSDQHLPVTEGSFPFRHFVTIMPRRLKWLTFEMHDENAVAACLANWRRLRAGS